MSLFDRVKWAYTDKGEPLTDAWVDARYSRRLGHLDLQTVRAVIIARRRMCGEAA